MLKRLMIFLIGEPDKGSLVDLLLGYHKNKERDKVSESYLLDLYDFDEIYVHCLDEISTLLYKKNILSDFNFFQKTKFVPVNKLFFKENNELIMKLANNKFVHQRISVAYLLNTKDEFFSFKEFKYLLLNNYGLLNGMDVLKKSELQILLDFEKNYKEDERILAQSSSINGYRYIRDGYFFCKELSFFLKLLVTYLEDKHSLFIEKDFYLRSNRPFFNAQKEFSIIHANDMAKKGFKDKTEKLFELLMNIEVKLIADMMCLFDEYLLLVKPKSRTMKQVINDCLKEIGYLDKSNFRIIPDILHFFNYINSPLPKNLKGMSRGEYKYKFMFPEACLYIFKKASQNFETAFSKLNLEDKFYNKYTYTFMTADFVGNNRWKKLSKTSYF